MPLYQNKPYFAVFFTSVGGYSIQFLITTRTTGQSSGALALSAQSTSFRFAYSVPSAIYDSDTQSTFLDIVRAFEAMAIESR